MVISPMEDLLYTRANHYASVNFDGFHDNETGIWGYTWALGRSICGTNVVAYTDPHEHLSSRKYWTNSGYVKGIYMEDGPYYATVQALNNIVYGGAVDFGLGKTKHDVSVRGYSKHAYVDRKEPFVVIEDLGLEEGVPAWIRLRAVNNVDLFKAGHGDEPILIDRSPPIPGAVLDGELLRQDIMYQSDATKICAQWVDFYDPESGIDTFIWGVGTEPQLDDIVRFHNLTHHHKHSCADVTLKHNTSYYSTVAAFNTALNSKQSNGSSDGVLVDLTPPLPGWIKDGKMKPKDIAYSSESATKNCYWGNFSDPESHMAEYEVSVYINREFIKTFSVNVQEEFFDHSISMKHLDTVDFSLKGTNGAGLSVVVNSDGFLIDHTPPDMDFLHDTADGSRYQSSKDKLNLKWKFDDSDSGIKEYRFFINQMMHGIKSRFWPQHEQFTTTTPASQFQALMNKEINGLSLTDGAKYSVHVTAINGALMSTSHESEGVIVDTSPPVITKKANIPGVIYDGRDQFIDTDYTIDKTSVALSFAGFESEACNIVSYEWAIGSEPYQSDILPYTDYGLVLHNKTHGHAQIHVQLYEDSKYYTSVRAKTGHNCHDAYIVSTSDGLKLDTKKPVFDYIGPDGNDTRYVNKHDTLFQSFSDSVDLIWSLNDNSPTQDVLFSAGRLPFKTDFHVISSTKDDRLPLGLLSLPPGEALFLSLEAEDEAGNIQHTASVPVMSDMSAPVVRNFSCTSFASVLKTSISCKWHTIEEYESILQTTDIRLGSYPLGSDLHPSVLVPFGKRSWTQELRFLRQNKNLTKIYVTMEVRNILHQKESFTFIITVDQTPPDKALVEFTTRIDDKNDLIKQLCQVPKSYVEISVRDLIDKESGIDRVEICLGTSSEQSDIKEFVLVLNATRIFIGGLELAEGSRVYATARIYNKAGLYSLTSSDPIVISPNPVLSVIDGPGKIDLDYQSDLNVLQGRWSYSDPCPIVDAEWAVEDLTGKVLQNFQQIPGNQHFFFNDELDTINGYLYFNKIRTRDALNRMRLAVSDGVAVRIQTPNPGYVRDGLEADIEYQQSVHDLSCNWDDFGNKNSKSPTQHIVRYEVAIGNDRRYTKTRSNVHYFVDVGLNNSFTFKSLNLTSKVVTYYITVRAYSEAGSYEEGYSNGVRVGFEEGIVAGTVEVSPYQFEIDKISVSWSSFMSDIGIKYYQLAISTNIFKISNTSIPCKDIKSFRYAFDVYNLTNVGLDKYRTINNLTLSHNVLYYPTVIGVDESDMCMVVTGAPVRVDTSAPDVKFSNILLNGRVSKETNLTYITDLSRLNVEWDNVTDHESGIKSIILSVEGINNCPRSTMVMESDFKVSEITVINDNKLTLYDLGLFPKNYYFIRLSIQNRAGLKSEIFSPMLLVDTTPPFAGTVKIGQEWKSKISFQFSDNNIHAFTAIAKSEDSYACPNQVSLFPDDGNQNAELHVLEAEYSQESVKFMDSSIVLKVGYNIPLTKVIKGGIKSDKFLLREGNFTFKATTAVGKNIISTFSLSSLSNVGNNFDLSPPLPDDFDTSKINFTESDNIEDLENTTGRFDNISTTENNTSYNTTETITLTSTPSYKYSYNSSYTANRTGELEDLDIYGFGVHILGKLQKNAKKWDCLFWAVDRFKAAQQWVTLDLNPSESNNEYIFKVTKEVSPTKVSFDIALIINGEVKSTINGMQYPDEVNIFSKVWNKDGYEEPLVDPFNPFRSQAEVFQIKMPSESEKPCLYGTGFYDGDSGIQEMWVGVSDSLNETDNISPMSFYKEYCLPCKDNCYYGCDPNCKDSKMSTDFEIDEIDITGLSLKSTDMTSNTSIDSAKTYYVNVKMKNFAGEESMAISNPIMIDKSPPVCEYIRCVDPRHSKDEPTEYIGSDSMLGAYWSCTEDISEIKQYIVSVGTAPFKSDMYNETDFKLQTRIQLNLTDSTFEHGNTYYLNLFVVNSADQRSNYSCHVHVELYPPDITHVTTQPMYSDKPTANSKEAALNSSLTHFNDRVGVHWNNKQDNIAFYGESGGVLFGYLEQNDLQQVYGTAASFTFMPFIVDPESTKWSTSKILRDRLVKYQNISFFMAPASEAEFQTMDISILYNRLNFDDDTVPALAFWNAELGVWKHVAESCISDIIGHYNGSHHSIPVCLDQLQTPSDTGRRKRSTATKVSQPTMVSFFKMKRKCSNRQPVIDDNIITVNEDHILSHNIRWHDGDSPADSVVFTLTKAPKHGKANITLDGNLNYIPASKFSGYDEITVTLKEINTSCNPHTVPKVITINVVDVNDPPVSGFLTYDEIFLILL
ncbi:hypothetical protein KUTeg_009918 [Tegillarca granosa]|uniref:Uncharacterized protein n=1 Tax=Tegillarca granosa TaxID=220873 RepID=A0ABQ9F592_TEGGR|nr:hypothetical protein KUTeg_009918 [Tegillarca granosa]